MKFFMMMSGRSSPIFQQKKGVVDSSRNPAAALGLRFCNLST